MDTLARVSNGDLRKAITTLQSAVRLQGPQVAPQTLLDVAGAIPDAAVQSVMRACADSSFQAVQDAITDVIADGYGVRGSTRKRLDPLTGPVGLRCCQHVLACEVSHVLHANLRGCLAAACQCRLDQLERAPVTCELGPRQDP